MNACPAQCIIMRRDREGYDYPMANPDRCIGCGKCESVCPVLNPREPSEPIEVFAARDDAYVRESSSGGVFPSIAAGVIGRGGVVYGAVVNEDMTIGHTDAEDLSSIDRMRGSKYVQSDLYGTFDEVKYYLREGREVMFSGTPCQIAGLKSYLGGDHESLLTVDCACHGVPSPGLWEKYVKALETKEDGKMKAVRFRDKSRSWMHYDFVCSFNVGDRTVVKRLPYRKDPFMALFIQDMNIRPSCYKCPARNGRSGSDLTFADLWNVAASVPEMNDDKGVSLVLANTEKGLRMLSEAEMTLVKVDSEVALKNNGGFAEYVVIPEKRAEFFKGHHSAANLPKYMKRYVARRPLRQLYKSLRFALSTLKRKLFR